MKLNRRLFSFHSSNRMEKIAWEIPNRIQLVPPIGRQCFFRRLWGPLLEWATRWTPTRAMRVIPQTPPRDLPVPRELRIARCSSRVFVGSAECSRRGTGGRGSPERCRTALTAFRFLPRKWAPQNLLRPNKTGPHLARYGWCCRSCDARAPWETMIRAVGRRGRWASGEKRRVGRASGIEAYVFYAPRRSVTGFEKHCRAHLSLAPISLSSPVSRTTVGV